MLVMSLEEAAGDIAIGLGRLGGIDPKTIEPAVEAMCVVFHAAGMSDSAIMQLCSPFGMRAMDILGRLEAGNG